MSLIADPERDIFNASYRGVQHHGMRRANERAVLAVVAFNPGLSNAEIARVSGLAPQTVSAILAEGEQAGLIRRGEVLRGRRGQPATPIYLRAEGAYAVGVEVGRYHVEVLLLDLDARVLARQRRPSRHLGSEPMGQDIAEMVAAVTAGLPPSDRGRLADLGIAVPASSAFHPAVVGAGEAAERWDAMAGQLRTLTGLTVTQVSSGAAACWGELIARPNPRPAGFLYLLVSHRIAAGVLSAEALLDGPMGNATDVGAMQICGSDGQALPAHAIASTSALAERLAAAGIAVDISAMEDWDWPSFGPILDRWLDDAARALATVIYNVTTVAECELAVIDGPLPSAVIGQLVARIGTGLQDLPALPRAVPQVKAGHLGNLAPAIGVAEAMLYWRYLSRAPAGLTVG